MTVILIQGISMYFLFPALTQWEINMAGLMLGTLFSSRGPVIGISLLVILIQYYLLSLPPLRQFMPAFLVLPAGQEPNTALSFAAAAAMGRPLSSLLSIAVTTSLTIVFLLVALRQFQREEF